MKKPDNPNKRLELIIKDSELPSLSKDFTEVAVDGIMDDGVLKDLPLVGGLIGMVKFGNSVNKYISAKKIYKFLFELHDIPQAKRIQKIDEINSSKKYQSTIGEMVFELLERIESDGKPEIIGKMFAAVIEEKIDYGVFLKCSHIVKNIFYYDLAELKNNYEKGSIAGTITDGILSSGLIKLGSLGDYKSVIDGKPNPNPTTLSELGVIVVKIGMK